MSKFGEFLAIVGLCMSVYGIYGICTEADTQLHETQLETCKTLLKSVDLRPEYALVGSDGQCGVNVTKLLEDKE